MNKSNLYHNPVDQALLERIAKGETAAMSEVFRAFYKRLLFFAFKMTENQMDAEDIVQQVFINFWGHIQEKQVIPDNVEGYLFRMVRNLCLTYVKRQRMIDGNNGAVIEEFYENVQRRMDYFVLREELLHEVKQHFRHLTSAQVQVMRCLYVEGLSISEAAEQMNTTEVNIRNHKSRALERLRTMVGQEILTFILLFSYFF